MTVTNSFSNKLHYNKNNPIVDMVADHFDRLRKRSDEGIEVVTYYKQNLFFVTAMFMPNTVGVHDIPEIKNGVPIGTRPSAMSVFGKCFLKINKHVLGSNLARKKHLQPICYAFYDWDDTRHGSGVEKKNLHIHGLMLVHPGTRAKFTFISRSANWFCQPQISSLVIEPFDPSRVKPLACGRYEKDPMKRCISYASKGYREFHSEDDGGYWSVFPKFEGSRASHSKKKLVNLVRDAIASEVKRHNSLPIVSGTQAKHVVPVYINDSIGTLHHKLSLVGLQDRLPELMQLAGVSTSQPAQLQA